MFFEKDRFGIVQGRLTEAPLGELQHFPQSSWKEEFVKAGNLGYGYIELLIERKDNKKDNPFWETEATEIGEMAKSQEMSIYSICSDYIIDHSLFSDERSLALDHTISAIEQAAKLKASQFILPLLEKSECQLFQHQEIAKVLNMIADIALQNNIGILLETLLPAKDLNQLLLEINHPNVLCVFDTGNRVNLTSNLAFEISKLAEKIGHVHIKDKNEFNENVIMGTGKVNFIEVAEALSMINYKGRYTFETTRGKNPAKTAKQHLNTWKFCLSEV